MKPNRMQALNVINSIKMGTVPKTDLSALIVGRDPEMKEIDRCLNLVSQGGSTLKLVVGPYGSGKSFLLDHISQTALKRRFIVSKTCLGEGFSFNKPEDLYYRIMHNLYSDSEQVDFDRIFEFWIDQLRRMGSKAASGQLNHVIGQVSRINRAFGTALQHYVKARIDGDKELSRAISAWIMGERNIPYEVKARFQVVGFVDKTNSFDFLIAFTHLIDLLGYNGFAILVDEFDLIMNQRRDYRLKALMNFRRLLDLCGSQTLVKTFFVGASTKRLLLDEEKGVPSYPALAQRLGKAIDPQHACLGDLRQPVLHLGKFSNEAIDRLSIQILDQYVLAFGTSPSISVQSLKKWVFYYYKKEGAALNRLSLREYLVKLIEILDIIDQNPDNLLFSRDIAQTRSGSKTVIGGRLK